MKFEIKPDIFDNFVDAVCILSVDLYPVYFNSSFTNLVEETSLSALRKKRLSDLLELSDFDWDRLKAATRAVLESPVRETPFKTKSREGRLQITWKSLKDTDGILYVLVYLRDVSLETTLNKKYHEELLKKEETIRSLDQHLFQISLIRDVLERTTGFDDPLVMLRNLFNHLAGILKIDYAMYLRQETINSMPILQAYSEQVGKPHSEMRDLSELIKPYLLNNTLADQTVGGFHWLSFRYLDDSDRQKFFVFGKKAEFEYQDEGMIETICEPLSFSMDNRELFRKAMTDELTDLYNHRYFKVRLENEMREHGDRKKTLGLLLIDIDHFKKINDTYGHLVGDHVLRVVSRALKEFCRATDVPARYGGEEFAVILPSIEEANILSIGERLRKMMESLLIEPPGLETVLQITVSVGVSVFPAHGRSPSELIGAADEALYEAKRSGRNRALLKSKAA